MSKNPYFLANTSEQRLVEDLTKEIISSMGRDVYYIPRKQFNKDYLFGEDPISKFKGSYKIEMYINSVNGFQGQGDLLSKFGIQLKDRVELVVSSKVFYDTITLNDSKISRPREGDLIYFPLSDTLFEINFVEHENPFYPLGKRYTYVLTCETFTYSHEDFDTGQSFIDDIETQTSTTGFEVYINSGFTSDFTIGETVFHIIGNGSDGPTAVNISNADGIGRVYNWKSDNNLLLLGDQSGTFNIESGEYLYGVSSGVAAEMSSLGRTNITIETSPETDTGIGDNIDLEKEETEKNIFDFTDVDPFSEGNY